MKVASIVYLDLKVVTTRPPSTYIFIPSLQFNSILEKLHFCCLMLKAKKFFCCWILKFLFATNVVGATGGSWLEGAYVLTPLPTNKARNRREWRSLEDEDQNSFQTSLLFFLALCFFLSRTYRKRGWTFLNLPRVIQRKKTKTTTTTPLAVLSQQHELQRHSVAALLHRELQRHSAATWQQRKLQCRNNASCSAATTQVTVPQQRELQRRNNTNCSVAATRVATPQQHELQRRSNTCNAATTRAAATQHHNNTSCSDVPPQQHELQRRSTATLRVAALLWVVVPERSKLQRDVRHIVSCHRRFTHAWQRRHRYGA